MVVVLLELGEVATITGGKAVVPVKHKLDVGERLAAVGLPDELLDGVVEVEARTVGRRSHGVRARELELVDEVLVAHLGEALALLGVEVDVVYP